MSPCIISIAYDRLASKSLFCLEKSTAGFFFQCIVVIWRIIKYYKIPLKGHSDVFFYILLTSVLQVWLLSFTEYNYVDLYCTYNYVIHFADSMSVWNLLREFRIRKVHMAVVLNEYGGTVGVCTKPQVSILFNFTKSLAFGCLKGLHGH